MKRVIKRAQIALLGIEKALTFVEACITVVLANRLAVANHSSPGHLDCWVEQALRGPI